MSLVPFAQLLDAFDAWQVFASGHAAGKLTRIAGPGGTPGLRLEYDFHEGAGFIAIRRPATLALPSTFEIGFLLRGNAPANHLELKVVSPDGANVWRHLRQSLAPPSEWTRLTLHERDLPFAWGPAGGGAPSAIGAVEFVVVAGPGGKGFLELAAPSLEDQTLKTPSAIRASSQRPGTSADAVLYPNPATGWQAAPDDTQPWWEVDFGRSQRFGGLVIQWPEPLRARAFTVALQTSDSSWRNLHRATFARGQLTHIPAPDAEARALRITFDSPADAALRHVALRPDAFTHSPNEFTHAVAADFPRGFFPRYWLREQSYWTTIGSPEGTRRALINEEGLVEVDEGSFSLEPFILTPGGPITWADAETRIALPKGGAPMPSAHWKSGTLRLDILPWVDGRGDTLALHVTYRLSCRRPTPGIRLVIATRPFQVNPPWQAFRNLGGRAPIERVTFGRHGVTVAGRLITTTPPPGTQGAAAFEEGEAPLSLTTGALPTRRQVDDPTGLAGAELAWDLPPGQATLTVTVTVPFFGKWKTPAASARSLALARWRRVLGAVKWRVPACAAPAFDVFRTAAGQILINRDRLALQPGPRRYTRSWIRDGVIMGAALAKAGLPAALRDYLTWYAPFQRDDGFVPCVVDRNGADSFVEHDSHGQFLWALREVVRHGAPRAFLTAMLPRLRRTVDYLIALRATRMTDHYRTGEHAACFGLLPESASHEGYLAHPVHSYWDDFWGIRGLEAAADLAELAGLDEEADGWRKEAALFTADLLDSMKRVMSGRKLTTLPGSVEWADFDPTATSNAIAMLDFADILPRRPLRTTLKTYLDGFHRKHNGTMPWTNYTAYEIRIIGAFVRLGEREIAQELLAFFLADRRPLAWNQWPEITWRDPRAPGHLGDVPHTWIAAEYLLALASMVASEREATDSLVLASGLPWTWISGKSGFAVSRLPTRYGPLEFMIRAQSESLIRVRIGASITLPPDGLIIVPPLSKGWRIRAIEGVPAGVATVDATGTRVIVKRLPFNATLRLVKPRHPSRSTPQAGSLRATVAR